MRFVLSLPNRWSADGFHGPERAGIRGRRVRVAGVAGLAKVDPAARGDRREQAQRDVLAARTPGVHKAPRRTDDSTHRCRHAAVSTRPPVARSPSPGQIRATVACGGHRRVATTREIVTAYLRAIEAHDVDEVARHLRPDVENLEHPNKLLPAGKRHDRAAMRAGGERGKAAMASERYEIHAMIVESNRAAVQIAWSGTLAVAAGPRPAGR